MKWKKWVVWAVIGLFLVANFYLIFKKDSEITRSTYVDEWTTIKEQNLVLSTNKPGVVTPLEEEHVYFQAGSGDFERFLVKEGEEVDEGTPLFQYSPRDIESTIENFEAEITKLESEWDAIDENIGNLEDLADSLSTNVSEEEGFASEATVSTIEAQIYEKELQLSSIEAEIEKYEDLISMADKGLDHLAMESEISGVVKKINHELKNPVVTITSNEMQIEGILNEEEVREIAEGMEAVITFDGLKGKVEGVVSDVAVNPLDDPHVEKGSEYRFTVELEEEPELDVLAGSHAEMKITLKKVEDAITVPAKALIGDYLYVLKPNGMIERRTVETGLSVHGVRELISEAEVGEIIAFQPGKFKNNTAFFTPIDVSKVSKHEMKEMGKKETLRYLGRGILTR